MGGWVGGFKELTRFRQSLLFSSSIKKKAKGGSARRVRPGTRCVTIEKTKGCGLPFTLNAMLNLSNSVYCKYVKTAFT